MSMAGEFRTILARKAQSLPAKIISVQNLSCQRSDVNLHMQVVTAESQVEMNLSQLLGEKLGYVPMMSITNPSYPLSFERYGDGNLDDDPEFKNEVRELVGRGRRDIPSCCSEWGAEEEVYSNKRIFRAESKARAAYGAVDPVNEARAALAISVNSPEAYNVLAIKAATTYEEALGIRAVIIVHIVLLGWVGGCPHLKESGS